MPGHEAEIRALLKRYAVEAENLPNESVSSSLPTGDGCTSRREVAHRHLEEALESRSAGNLLLFARRRADHGRRCEGTVPGCRGCQVHADGRDAALLSAAPFSDHTLRQYAASDDLAMSAFEYAYRSKRLLPRSVSSSTRMACFCRGLRRLRRSL